jgi:hypothetical protein
MRRQTVRLALALVATSFLAACADMATGPDAGQVRFDGTAPSADTTAAVSGTTADTTNTRATSSQGSQI